MIQEIQRLQLLAQSRANELRESTNPIDKQLATMALGKAIAYGHVLLILEQKKI